MSVYTYADARQHFDLLFTEAKADKEVLIESPEGDVFLLRRMTGDTLSSSLPRLGIHLSRQEITEYIRETRER